MASLVFPSTGASYLSSGELAAKITGLDGSYSYSGRTVTWYYGTSTSSFTKKGTTTLDAYATSISYTYEGLTPGRAYYVKAVIDNITGASAVTLTSSNKYCTPIPACASLSKSSVTSTGATVSWTYSGYSGSLKHYLYLLEGDDGTDIQDTTSSKTVTFSDLTPGTSYTFTVRAVVGISVPGATEEWGEVESITFKTSAPASYTTTIRHLLEDPDVDGEYTQSGSNISQTMTQGKTYYVSDYTKNYTGYTFSHATYGGEEIDDAFVPDASRVLRIYYTANSYSLKVMKNVGTNTSFTIKKGDGTTSTVTSGNSIKIKYGWTVTATASLLSGYIFSYWYSDPTNGPITDSNRYSNPITFKMPGYNFTINAVGVEKPLENYTVNFKHYCQAKSGGTSYELERRSASTYEENSSVSIADFKVSYSYFTLVKVTYQKNDGTEIEINKDTGSVTITAETTINYYYNRNTYYLTMQSNSNMSSTYLINGQSFSTGVALPFFYGQSLRIKVTPNSGYLFSKWSTSPTVSGVQGSGENEIVFEMPSFSFTMSAIIIEEAETYTITVKNYFENPNDENFTYNSYYDTSFPALEGSTITLSDEKVSVFGFAYSYGTYNGTKVESIKVTGNTTIKLYYLRNRFDIVVRGDSHVDYFTANGYKYGLNTALGYKYGQEVTLVAYFKSGYTIAEWQSEQLVIPSEVSETLYINIFPNENVNVYIVSKEIEIELWEWNDEETDAFENNGDFSTLTASRWNAFLTWCNKVIKKKGGTQIDEGYFGESGQPLYASHFTAIVNCLKTVATIPTDEGAKKNRGDIIKGSYFINLAKAMNDIL